MDIVKKPVLIEMWDERFFYFVLKFEFNFVDTMDKASALSTVQIDVENAERYDITYVDETGEKQRPITLALLAVRRHRARHVRPPGEGGPAFGRRQAAHAADLALAYAGQDHTSGERHQARAFEVAKELGFRTDVDERDETVGKKIRDAGREWIPYVAVIGDEELDSGQLNVTIRADSTPKNAAKSKMTIEYLRKRLTAETAGKPWRRLALSMKVSERPKFI